MNVSRSDLLSPKQASLRVLSTGLISLFLGVLAVNLVLSTAPEGTSMATMQADYRLEQTRDVAEGCPKLAELAKTVMADGQVTVTENDKVQRSLVAMRAATGDPQACPVRPARSYRIAAEQAQGTG